MKVKSRMDENNKCGGCNWNIYQLFGFDCNPDSEMICGECFASMLVEGKFVVEAK